MVKIGCTYHGLQLPTAWVPPGTGEMGVGAGFNSAFAKTPPVAFTQTVGPRVIPNCLK